MNELEWLEKDALTDYFEVLAQYLLRGNGENQKNMS
jgi:hypothetical protein